MVMMRDYKKGESFIIHGCIEAEKQKGKVFKAKSDQFKDCDGKWVIFLEGYTRYIGVDYLKRVNVNDQTQG